MANKVLQLNATTSGDVIKINGKNLTEAFNGRVNSYSGVNLNTLTISGTYFVYNGTSALNYPDGVGGILLVFEETATQIIQVYLRQGASATNSKTIYKRSYISGTWTSWNKICTSYIVGDTVSITHYIECAGLTGNNTTTCYFTIPLSVPINDDVSGVTFTNLTLSIGGVNGRILASTEIVGHSTISLTSWIDKGTNAIIVRMQNLTGCVAVTPQAVEISSMSFTFS